MPEQRKGPRWHLIGAGVVLLAVAGVAAKAYASSGALFSASAGRGGEIQDWEELPGMDKVIKKAQSLTLKHPLRNLNDLFYDSQPEELPWIRTEPGCMLSIRSIILLFRVLYVHIFLNVCMYVCMHACMHACMYVCMHVCMYVCFCCFFTEEARGVLCFLPCQVWGTRNA